MFNTEPPAGARAVPGGECRDRPGRRPEEGLGSRCVMAGGEAWVGLNRDAEPVLCLLVVPFGESASPGLFLPLCSRGCVQHTAQLFYVRTHSSAWNLDANFILPFPKDSNSLINSMAI